ncbi:phosphoglycerate dehydrogenase [Taylorella equigenitalis]|uniref:D-3-phosphoglycerate dehydrogenase n=2 Tax=Taylorella equigenitalis TaxID=29575 RepID=A0A654KI27_TAYEM|nr:phosphoglycerate dehydrogenase [Taylorella equigenitalis]ADU91546.1 D-3-phosphoglycerate dehydrogenase [Taylorella equigenitalis MCE9]AFN36629.1 phosphoglycerate dehydrogenase [Taylorella equigenitalis ATCC 35865]ASY31191.1 D-3-phosphoglycerate dehydrogenase [Taylorella equigenitalis]ASY40029.1 D-3-phosphoglycerate dehydrogenase [Taylorella equigenitalis]KOS59310.1 3-phosphoglycerate dehydrogenase [Taylorella equigenitalis]
MEKFSLDKDKIKIVLLEGVHPNALEVLGRNGYTNIDYHKKALEGDDLIEAISDAHFIGIRSRTQLTEEVLSKAQKLIGIGCFCIGTNQVNLEAATKRGIAVFNAPFSNTRSVAELVLAEMILLMRKVPQASTQVHRGEWKKSADGCHEVRGKKLGIIGYGNIGTQISVLAEALGMEVIFNDIEAKLPIGNAREVPVLEDLLAQSDIVTLHVPEDETTKNLMSAERIAKMKKDSILINASRGTVVDIDGLAAALESGHLAGAAIDVFPKEPKSNQEEFVSPLRAFENVILTPHIGGSTVEAQFNIGTEVASKIVAYSDVGTTITSVNFPEVGLTPNKSASRFMHIHENKPGVLAEVNKVFIDSGLNILGQYLQTNAEIGYVVVDTVVTDTATILDKLKAIDGTIKTRVIY